MPKDAALASTLRYLAGLKGRTLVTSHSLFDLDSVASALTVAAVIDRTSKSTATVRCLDMLNSSAKHAVNALGLQIEPLSHADDLKVFDNIVFVDVGTNAQLSPILGGLKAFRGKVVVTDPHESNTNPIRADHALRVAQPACAVIAYELARQSGTRLGKNAARLLAAACVSDTARFKTANAALFSTLADLMTTYKLDYVQVLRDSFANASLPERVERLSAVSHATIKLVERQARKRGQPPETLVIAITTARAFELHVASHLVELGADYAFVSNPERGRVEGVRNETLPDKYPGIGEVLERVARTVGGNGGGHPGVGGWTGNANLTNAALDACVQLVRQSVEK